MLIASSCRDKNPRPTWSWLFFFFFFLPQQPELSASFPLASVHRTPSSSSDPICCPWDVSAANLYDRFRRMQTQFSMVWKGARFRHKYRRGKKKSYYENFILWGMKHLQIEILFYNQYNLFETHLPEVWRDSTLHSKYQNVFFYLQDNLSSLGRLCIIVLWTLNSLLLD